MHPEDLRIFKENIADPAMKKRFDTTEIPDGLCCIDTVSIAFLDGRSWGIDTEFKANGFIYDEGKVKAYSFCEYDIDFEQFIEAHKDHVFISDGRLRFYNELGEFEMNTVMRSFDVCAKLHEDLEKYVELSISSSFSDIGMQYEKMKYMFAHDEEIKKMSLAEQIKAAEGQRKEPEHQAIDNELDRF